VIFVNPLGWNGIAKARRAQLQRRVRRPSRASEENGGSKMGEAMWEREDMGTHPMPTWAMYAEAMNKFSRSATAFMEHVHLLTEARTAYQEAMAVGTELRNRLDAGEQTLRSLMAQLSQVVNDHLNEPAIDRKKPELVKGETIRMNSQNTGTEKAFP
jgi:hypothetical protein